MDVLHTFVDMLTIPVLVLLGLCLFWATAQATVAETWDRLIRQVDASRVDRQSPGREEEDGDA